MLLTQLLFYNIYMFLQIETENKIKYLVALMIS